MGSIPVRVMNKIPDLRIRDFFMQPVRGIEGTRPPAGGKKETGGLFFSVRVPTARNVYRGCCRYDPYGSRTARPPIGGKQQSSGLLFSAGVPPCRNVYCGCCNLQPVRGIEGTRPPAGGKKEPSGLFFSVTGCGTQRLPRPLKGPCILRAAAPTTPPCIGHWPRSSLLQVPSCRNVYRGCCRCNAQGRF